MDTNPSFDQSQPPIEPIPETPVMPPAPPKKSNRTMWIIIIVVVILLCCCCIAVVAAGYYTGTFQNIINSITGSTTY
jgi:hypothetical protein